MKYDYLVVGAGLFSAVFVNEMRKAGKSCYVIEKRDHIAGNVYTENEHGISVHKYGAHIFHTSDKEVWEYVNKFAQFNHYVNSPIAVYKDEIYNLPFNMNTFSKMWGVKTPAEAKKIIADQIAEAGIQEPRNLEEQAISLAGTDVYEKLVKGYTEKQWGRDCKELPAFIIKRLPLRFVYDNNYFNDRYQGIPIGGYTQMVEKMFGETKVELGITYQQFLERNSAAVFPEDAGHKEAKADAWNRERIEYEKVLYTGMIDEFFDYKFGELEYRSLRFESEYLPEEDNFQGNAVVNYTEREIPYTRIIEHKHFDFGKGDGTVITREYSAQWQKGDEPYYPMNDEKNSALYERYAQLAKEQKNVLFGGRLGQYKYYDMDKVIRAALDMAAQEL